MVKKFQHLRIDTKSVLRPPSLSDVDENKVVSDFNDEFSHSTSITPIDKRYSTSILQSDFLFSKHRRSASTGNELACSLPRVSSVPDFTQPFAKSVQKKRWFQRVSLKRNPSTPIQRMDIQPNSAVEPPEPPPRLLFNLQWSSEYPSSLWNSDDNSSHSVSTPTSTISRSSSKIDADLTIFEENAPPTMSRRLSAPLCNDFDLGSEGLKENSKRTSLPLQAITTPRLFSKKTASKLPKKKASTPTISDNELSTIFIPCSDDPLLHFNRIRPRAFKAKYRCNPKQEAHGLYLWQKELQKALDLDRYTLPKIEIDMDSEKKEKRLLTRRFILREFYTTEINFWNQLNYTKVMFCDPLQSALDKCLPLVKWSDLDLFSNLEDLMRFSFMLVYRLKELGFEETQVWPESDFNIGLVLREMAEPMVVFLRCALDYGTNKKLLDKKHLHKVYGAYRKKLALKKETRQFTFQDYLIIPIQRITRYGLLLTDLEKHTEVSHPDYQNIRMARILVHSLASAMNQVQK
ncbi:Dbl homology domain-containing protein [Sporodiniella umbellata]|nr:Dbl homology domain-containing protein [Sporodiniella umbellata]